MSDSVTTFISRRFNARSTLPPSIRAMRTVSAIGIAIAVAALVVATSIGHGFESRYQSALMNFNAHVVVMGGGEMSRSEEVLSQMDMLRYSSDEEAKLIRRWGWTLPFIATAKGILSSLHLTNVVPECIRNFVREIDEAARRGVVASTPFLYREALSVGGGKIRGVVIKGIDSATMRDVNPMSIKLFNTGDSLNDLLSGQNRKVVRVIAGRTLASELGVADSGGKIRLLIPREVPSKGGGHDFEEIQVAGIFESGMRDYDAQFLLMSLGDERRLFQAEPNAVTGVELRLDDPARADLVAARIDERLGPEYRAITWSELNADLLAAVRLEKLVSALIMGIMVVVAALNIVAVIVLITIHRFHEIAVLKALGLSDRMVRSLLIRGGASVGIFGVGAGLISGLGVAWSLGRFNLIPLEAEIYLIESLPIDISPLICGMIASFCLGAGFLTSTFAARRLSRVSVAEGLRAAG